MFYMPTFSIHLSKVKSLQTMHVKFFENSINNKIQLKGYLIIQIFKSFVNMNIVIHYFLMHIHILYSHLKLVMKSKILKIFLGGQRLIH